MTFTRIIGIDPGAKGALAFLTTDGRAVVHKTSDTLPMEALQDAMAGVSASECVAYLELVGGYIPGRPQPASRTGVLMRSLGLWEGLLLASGIRCSLTRPQAWQAGIPGRSKVYAVNKRALRAEAARRFPRVKVTLDTCDALLIADFGRRVEWRAAA